VWIRASNPPKTKLRCYVGQGGLLAQPARARSEIALRHAIIFVDYQMDTGIFICRITDVTLWLAGVIFLPLTYWSENELR
jgi:hypothetical protein